MIEPLSGASSFAAHPATPLHALDPASGTVSGYHIAAPALPLAYTMTHTSTNAFIA